MWQHYIAQPEDTRPWCAPADLTDERDLSVITRLACGAFAGTFGQTVAYPLDVVRRRLQVIIVLLDSRICTCIQMVSRAVRASLA